MRRWSLVTCCLLLSVFCSAVAAWAQLSPRTVDHFAQRSLLVGPAPGLSVAVVDGDSIYVRGYGHRGLDRKALVDADTLFAIGSCTKSMAAASVAELVEEGRVDWDERVTKYLPWFRASDPWITSNLRVRDLVTHRAGLRAAMPRQAAPDRRTYLESIAHAEPLHPFRAEFGYANDMFTLSGELVSTVSGLPWESFVRERFWVPLGMPRTNADSRLSRADPNAAIPTIVLPDGTKTEVPWIYEDWAALPSGGVNSSARDLSKWVRFQLSNGEVAGNRLLSPASMKEMQSPQTVLRGPLAQLQKQFSDALGGGEDGIRFESYGMGWFIHDFRGRTILYHLGAIPGFRCVLGLAPEHRFGVAILVNGDVSMQSIALFQDLLEAKLGMPDRNWAAAAATAERRQRAQAAKTRSDIMAGRLVNSPLRVPLASFSGAFVRGDNEPSVLVRAAGPSLRIDYGRLTYEASHWHGDTFRLIPTAWRVYGRTISWPFPTERDPLAFARFELDPGGRIVAVQMPFGRFRRTPDQGRR